MFRRRPDAKHGKNGCVIGMIWQSARILSFALSDGLSGWLTSVIYGNLRMYSVVNGLLVSRNIGMGKRTGCHSHGLERTFGYIPLIRCGLKFDQGRGIAIVPRSNDRGWWWSLSEVVVERVDVPVGETLLVDHDGKVRSADREYRIVVVDALGWTPEESQAEPADTADKQRAVWDSTLPCGDNVALHPQDCTISAPLSHRHPKPSLESLMHGTSNHQVQQVSLVQVNCRRMQPRAHREATKRAKSGRTSQSECEASPGPDNSSLEESDTMHERPLVTTPPVMNESCVDRSSLGPREISQHDWLQGYRRHIRSVIKSDEDWEGCEDLKAKIMARYEKTVFNSIRTQDVAPAAKKARGPHSTLRLELFPEHAGPRADRPGRAVGEREKALWDKIVKFKDRGMLPDAEGQPQWVARAFLVPKPGKNDCRLVIDYRHLNSCLKGSSFFAACH